MYDDFDYTGDMGTMYDGGYGDDSYMDYGDMAYGTMPYSQVYKPRRATPKNVKDEISMQLGCYPNQLRFEMLDSLPKYWRHSCYFSGIVQVPVNSFEYEDGSWVFYTICPFFPDCNKVHVYIERNY